MGIRFACHVCGKHLNIKAELAGKRGICPACSSRFRIPKEDAEQSTPIEEPSPVVGATSAGANKPTANKPTANGQSAAQPASSDQVVANSQTQSVATTTSATPVPAGVTSLDILTSDPNATWYVRPPTGGQYGPANGEILKQWIAEGRVASTALLWRDGWPQWREASEALPELVERLPATSPAGSATGATAAPGMTAAATAQSTPQTATQNQQSRVTLGNAQLPASQSTVATTKHNAPVAANQPVDSVSQPSSAPITSDSFGYEDSDFANGKSYAPHSVQTAGTGFVGRNSVGKERRQRASRRTLSIVVLGLIAVLLLLALAFVMTQQS